MGLEDDQRTGAVRIDPSSIVAKAGDLTPAIAQLSSAFSKGLIQANDIHDRFSARANAERDAATATAQLQTRRAQEVGPLEIEARKAQLSPDLVEGQANIQRGQIDEELANQDLRKKTRKQRDKIFQAQVGQGLDEITQHLPAATIAQLNNQFPQLGAEFDELGRVTNGDAVKARLPGIVNYQKFLDSAVDLNSQFETKEVNLGNDQKGLQTVWRGTNRPVPKALLDAAVGAKEAKFGAGFSPTGQATAPGQFADPTSTPAAGTGTTPQPLAADRVATPLQGAAGLIPQPGPGDLNEEGILLTGQASGGKPTEIEARANTFFRRMALSESQYADLLATGYDPASPKNTALREAVSITSKIPLVGPAVAATGIYPKEAFQADQVIKNFTSAVLRDESGAAIRDDERKEYERMFFPLAGEPPESVALKAQQRASAAAALKQVAERKLTPEDYERFIEQMTGRQYPVATSTREVTDFVSSQDAGTGPIVNGKPSPTPAASAIPRIRPGDPIPPNAEWVWFEGEAQPRRRRKAPAAPSPAAPTRPQASVGGQLSLPQGVLNPANLQNPSNFQVQPARSVGGIRG